jgi:hypothetical protein
MFLMSQGKLFRLCLFCAEADNDVGILASLSCIFYIAWFASVEISNAVLL